MYDLDFSPLKNQAQNDCNVRTLYYTEPKAKYLNLSFIFKFNPATHFCFLPIWSGNACVTKDAPLEFEKPRLVAVNAPVAYFQTGLPVPDLFY